MLNSHKYRIYPTENQKLLLAKAFGCCRFVYNNALEFKQSKYINNKENVSYNFLASNYLTSLKNENPFLKETYSQSIQFSIRNLDKGYQNFFKGISKLPKFKKKHSRQSCTFPQNVKVNFKDSTIILPKIGKIIAVFHRKFEGEVKSCTISKTPSHKYFISINFRNNDELPSPDANGKAIGIDLGLKHFLITSEHDKIDNPRFYHQQLKKLKKIDKVVSRKKKGSNNFAKAKFKKAKLHQKICNRRDDFQHKLSSKIINENQVIILEDLSVKNLLANSYRNISRSIGDVSWSSFVTMLRYKAERRGKILVQIDRFEPSSKRCFVCQNVNEDLDLSDRTWECPTCGIFHDRDLNAAYNIKEMGLKDLHFEFGLEHPELKSLGKLRNSIQQELNGIGRNEKEALTFR